MDIERELQRPQGGQLPAPSFSTQLAPLRVVLVDRQPMFRSGLRVELERIADCVVLGEAGGIRDLLPLLLSGLLYELTLLPGAPSSDYRYSHWMVICTVVALVCIVARRARVSRPDVPAA